MAVPRIAAPAILSVLLAAALGCTDDDAQPDGGLDTESDTLTASCLQMVETLCARSCDCSVGAEECHYFTTNFYANHTSEKGCLEHEGDEYCSGDFFTDFDTCRLALETASCGEFRDDPGLQLPVECSDIATHMTQ